MDCWLSKVSADPPPPLDSKTERFFRRRRRQEPVVAEMLADEGVLVSKLSYGSEPNRYTDDVFDWMRAEIDFEFPMTPSVRQRFPKLAHVPDGSTLNGEIKTSYGFLQKNWGDEDAEEVPVEVAAQNGWGMMVARRPACLTAVLIGVDDLRCYPILRDPLIESWMREAALKFWFGHVLTGIPPEPKNVEDIKRLYESHRGKPVDLTSDVAKAITEIMMLRAANSANEMQIADREFAVLNHVRKAWGIPAADALAGTKAAREAAWRKAVAEVPDENAVLLLDGMPYATWRLQSAHRLDGARLREERPEIAREFTTESRHRVLRHIKGKGEKS